MTAPNTSATGGFLQPTSPPALEDDALAIALQATVAGITGIDGTLVRPRWQATPPQQPEAQVDWCGIGVLNEEPEGNMVMQHDPSGDGFSVSYQNVILEVMASFYGPNAGGYANILREGLLVTQNRDAMKALNLNLVGEPGGTKKAPVMVNNRWLNRTDISFRIRHLITRTWAIENIIAAGGTIYQQQGSSAGEVEASQPFLVTEDSQS